MSRGAEASRRHKYARESWGAGVDESGWRGGSTPAGVAPCRHDRDDPRCGHDWRDDEVAVAALGVLVASHGDVIPEGNVRLTLRYEHGVHATSGRVRRSLFLLGRHRLADRVANGLDSEGYPRWAWRARLAAAKGALASVAA